MIHDAILNRAPASITSLNPELPGELDRTVTKALEKDRELRYQHAADIRTDLKRLKRATDSRRAVAAGLPRQDASGGGVFSKERLDRELAARLEGHLQMHIDDNPTLRNGSRRGAPTSADQAGRRHVTGISGAARQ